ncbi:MAG: hypothetical protein AAF960_03875 [Bacteroidota bacterium]
MKRIYFLFIIGCILLSACKSTDCGCPMASEAENAKDKVGERYWINNQQEWRIAR